MPYQVWYKDEATGYEWAANFESEEEALAQAAMDTYAYGGEAPQEVIDGDENVVKTHDEIIAEADKLPGE